MNKTFSIIDSIVFGFRTFLSNFLFFVGIFLVPFAFLFGIGIIAFVLILIARILPVNVEIVHTILYTIISILMIFIVSAFVLGYTKISLEFYDKKAVSLSSFFSCFYLIPKFLIALIISLILFVIGFAFFVIPGIIIASRLMLFPYFIVDKNVGPIESITKSFNVTKGHTLRMVGLFLLTELLDHTIIFYPVVALSYAYAYRNLSK